MALALALLGVIAQAQRVLRTGAAAAAEPAGAEQHSFIFMGGLQRSGTTWLEGLVASSVVSGLSFDNTDLQEYETVQPWLLQNKTRAYFEMVTKFGGVEGKFVQDVYRYMYLVRDVGKDGLKFASLLPDHKDVNSAAASRLFSQWSLFWDTSKPILLEKTPENFVMGTYLQMAFGSQRTKFVFIMRHPLIWALAIEKWISVDFVALRTVEERVAFWFETMSCSLDQLASLQDVVVLQLELVSASLEMQLAVSRHLLCHSTVSSTSQAALKDLLRPPGLRPSSSILSSSLAYVTCWLTGLEFKTSLKRCVARKSFRDPAFGTHVDKLAVENVWRLRQMATENEVHAKQFGYSFQPYVHLAKQSREKVLRARVVTSNPDIQAAELGVHIEPIVVSSRLRPHLAISPSHANIQVASETVASDTMHVLLAYHKMGFDSDKPTGMDIRMSQIVQSLVDLRITVHFVCHCEVDASQLNPYSSGVIIYFGSLKDQYQQAARAAPIRHALLFFTTLTMFVHQRMVQGEADWHKEPTTQLPEEQLLTWLHHDFSSSSMCVIAIADDIHYLRSVEVMRRYDLSKAVLASQWIRRRELTFYASVSTVITVSQEDSKTLNAAFKDVPQSMVESHARACAHCSCSFTWVPYVVDVTPEPAIESFEERRDGILYVGGMHGLAVVAIEWLIERVQQAIAAQSPRAGLELASGGMGHLFLAGPGWSQHVNENPLLNRSVEIGHVTLLGVLSELQLLQRLQTHKVFAAPVFNGTGIATKNVLAMARGIPLVTTSVGLNGLGLPDKQDAVLVADDPLDFAQKLVWVQTSPQHFNSTWRKALLHASMYLSPSHQRVVLCDLLRCTSSSSTRSVSHGAELLCDGQANVSTVPSVQAIVEETRAYKTRASLPVIILGLWGAGTLTIASRLHSFAGCIVRDPLQGIAQAPGVTQVDHLTSILEDSKLCQALVPDQSHERPVVHGFALEFSPQSSERKLLATKEGLEAFTRMLHQLRPHVLIVRHCDMSLWAAKNLLGPACSWASDIGSSCQQGHLPSFSPEQLHAEVNKCDERDAALQLVLQSSGSPTFVVSYEWLNDDQGAIKTQTKIASFFGVNQSKAIIGLRKSWSGRDPSTVLEDSRAAASKLENKLLLGLGIRDAQVECREAPKSAQSMGGSWGYAVGLLASYLRAQSPVLAFAVHQKYGGAAVVNKVVGEACKEWLTPQLGIRCVFLNGFEPCDPTQSDLCVHQEARFSAGRLAYRGYRLVHIVRDPLEVLTRSFLAREANSTSMMNSTAVLARFEAHIKTHVSEELHDMQAISEGHSEDPNYLRVRLEDLLSSDPARRNSTLSDAFGFLTKSISIADSNIRIPSMPTAVFAALLKAHKSEEQGSTQRKHLVHLLQRRPAKCLHINKLQLALKYPVTTCTLQPHDRDT